MVCWVASLLCAYAAATVEPKGGKDLFSRFLAILQRSRLTDKHHTNGVVKLGQDWEHCSCGSGHSEYRERLLVKDGRGGLNTLSQETLVEMAGLRGYAGFASGLMAG